MNITKHFTLDELCKTSTGLDNTPDAEVIGRLSLLAKKVLQPLRDKYGKAITVNSGYRSPDVNKKVGGASSSQHLKGEAADITAGSKAENKKLYALLDSMEFDNAINERDFTWIHVSFKTIGNRKQKLSL